MRLFAAAIIALVVAVHLGPGTPPAYAQETGDTRVVDGQVVNGTSDGGSASGLTVTLHMVSFTGRESRVTATDSEGRFRFDGVAFDSDTLYGVSLAYQGVVYSADLDLSAGSPPPVLLSVYDSTDAVTSLEVSSASVWYAEVDRASRSLAVLEIVNIGNNTDRTYVPGPEPMKLLRFGLPLGASDLTVDTTLVGADVIQVDRGFALTSPVPPGAHEVAFSYVFPYTGDGADLTRSYPYGAGSLRVIASPQVASVSSRDLDGPETVTIGGSTYQLMTATDIPRGHRISLELRGLSQPSFGERARHALSGFRLEYAAPAGLVILMAVLIGFGIWRGGDAHPARSDRPPGGDTPDVRRQRLFQEIAELQASFEKGAVGEEEYVRLRQKLMAGVADISERLA